MLEKRKPSPHREQISSKNSSRSEVEEEDPAAMVEAGKKGGKSFHGKNLEYMSMGRMVDFDDWSRTLADTTVHAAVGARVFAANRWSVASVPGDDGEVDGRLPTK